MKKLIIIFVFIIGLFLTAFLFRNKIASTLQNAQIEQLKDIPFVGKLAQILQKEINNPGPLVSNKNAPNAHLTRSGTISLTNKERNTNGLSSLTENELLNQSAQKKLEDMFQRQYFEHESPTGEGPSDVVESVGYEYITTGENLALGNFLNDKELVDGWMNSPGHRANILNSKYTEIGVAVGQGLYKGRKTWIAVQHFGKPLSSCPSVDESLLSTIKDKSAQAEVMSQDLEKRRQELENSKPKTPEEAEEYNRKINEYNEKVREYNALIEEIKSITNQYNSQVNAFNACAKG